MMAGFPGSELGPGFQTTHWNEIRAARTSTPQRRQEMLDNLARRYWKPIYLYLRAKQHGEADARDAAQEFFLTIVLERDLFGRADPRIGRFRDFLLRSLKNFLKDQHRHAQARRRFPDGVVLSLERWMGAEGTGYDPPAPDSNPEALFHRSWAVSLLERALACLNEVCAADRLSTHWEIFRERVVRPTLFGEPPTALEELAKRYNLTAKQVANRTETVRRRFRKVLFDEIRPTVGDEAELEDELCFLIESLRNRTR
jgi:RNA polymerase sigma-70 factor (ECF subfamily)